MFCAFVGTNYCNMDMYLGGFVLKLSSKWRSRAGLVGKMGESVEYCTEIFAVSRRINYIVTAV